MNKRIIIKYNSETKIPEIECENRKFDANILSKIDISEWAIPFLVDNIRWNGLYEELKDYYGCDSYTVIFQGSDDDMSAIKQAFSDKPVNVAGVNNKVIIIYDKETLITKITVNGKIFDVSRIDNHMISEWVMPFSYENIEWKGIFTEIDEFLGTDSYSIQFIGNPDDMRVLMDNSPPNINITYKKTVIPKKKDVKTCSKCGATISFDSKFCVTCGSEQNGSIPEFYKPNQQVINNSTQKDPVMICSKCGSTISSDSKFCVTCGSEQNGLSSESSINNQTYINTPSKSDIDKTFCQRNPIGNRNPKNESSGFISGIRSECEKMKINEPELLLVVKITIAVYILVTVISVIVDALIYLFLLLPVVLGFSIFAFNKGYKKTAVGVFVLALVLFIIFIIITSICDYIDDKKYISDDSIKDAGEMLKESSEKYSEMREKYTF